MMEAMDSRQPSLLEGPAPLRAPRIRPGGLLPRSPRGAVEIVRHADGPLEVKVSGLIDSAERRIRRWQGVAAMTFSVMVVGAAAPVAVVALRGEYERGRGVPGLPAELRLPRARRPGSAAPWPPT